MMNSNYLAESVSLQKIILKFFVIATLLFSVPAAVYGQEAVKLEKFLEEKSNNKEVVRGFVFENIPAVSWKEGALVTEPAQTAQKLITDVVSLSQVTDDSPQNRSVKFLQINIENGAEKGRVRLTPRDLASFVNLQYVFIQSQVALTASEASAMVSGYEDGDIVLLFKVISNY